MEAREVEKFTRCMVELERWHNGWNGPRQLDPDLDRSWLFPVPEAHTRAGLFAERERAGIKGRLFYPSPLVTIPQEIAHNAKDGCPTPFRIYEWLDERAAQLYINVGVGEDEVFLYEAWEQVDGGWEAQEEEKERELLELELDLFRSAEHLVAPSLDLLPLRGDPDPASKYFGGLNSPSTQHWISSLSRVESEAVFFFTRYLADVHHTTKSQKPERLSRCRFCLGPMMPVRGRATEFCGDTCRRTYHNQARSAKAVERRAANRTRYRRLMESLSEHLRDPGWEDVE